MMKSYSANLGATFVRNPHYWGKPAIPSTIEWTFYPGETQMTTALESNQIDCLDQFFVSTSPQLLNGSYNISRLRGSGHRELSMRTDLAPFNNKYVRQAIALVFDRPDLVKTVFKGYADLGNDSPFAPVFPATVGPPAVPQRAQNIALAKQLLAKGGVPRGFKTPFYTEQRQEMPDVAQFVKQWASEIGVDITLVVEPPNKYYGNTFGSSDWLDGQMSMVDYGARSTPNLFLEAPLQTRNAKTGAGEWNAARFNNATYDTLSKQYVAAVDLTSQRKIARQIELLLLDETPIIFPYFYNYMSASQKNVSGIYPTALSQMFLWNANKS